MGSPWNELGNPYCWPFASKETTPSSGAGGKGWGVVWSVLLWSGGMMTKQLVSSEVVCYSTMKIDPNPIHMSPEKKTGNITRRHQNGAKHKLTSTDSNLGAFTCNPADATSTSRPSPSKMDALHVLKKVLHKKARNFCLSSCSVDHQNSTKKKKTETHWQHNKPLHQKNPPFSTFLVFTVTVM